MHPQTHTNQLLLVAFYDTIAGIGSSFRTDGRQTDSGRTDRRGSENGYLDIKSWLHDTVVNLVMVGKHLCILAHLGCTREVGTS